MMFAKVMATAMTIGALGGASLALAQNVAAPTAITANNEAHLAQRADAACSAVDFRIYFEPGSSALNSQARDTIASATRDVGACGRVDVEVAADVSRIDSAGERRLSSQRSVSVLSEMRRQGVAGDVYVAPVHGVVVASEANPGPDFVEIAISPSSGGQLLSSMPTVRTSSDM